MELSQSDKDLFFLRSVAAYIEARPELISRTIEAVQQGLMARLNQEQEKRSKAEAALVMAYGAKNLSPAQDTACRKVIVGSHLVSGTTYAQELSKDL